MQDAFTLPDGRKVHAVTLKHGNLSATVLTLGVIVRDLRIKGVDHPVVLGCADIADYLDQGRYVGAIVGRYANRIGGAQFQLDGRRFHTDPNFLDRHSLHGGTDGIDRHIWQPEEVMQDRATFRLTLPDGHMGFPGNLALSVTVMIEDDALQFRMSARTDQATPCNLAHHGYFNLDGRADILSHRLRIDADRYIAVDDDLIPVGDPVTVDQNDFDFRRARKIGTGGYDHNFCLPPAGGEFRAVAELAGEGRVRMQVLTDAPGLQVYDGAHFTDLRGLDGRSYGAHAGIALETQNWPDAPNRPDFPDAILRPGQVYSHRVAYRFALR